VSRPASSLSDVSRLIELLLHPERRRADPEPARIDLRRVFLVGIAVWLLALTAECIRWAGGADGAVRGAAICVVGLALGFVGLRWDRRHPEASHSTEV